MSNQATEQMLRNVETVRRRAKSAEREFDRANDMIQRKASRSIDLFGGSATNTVVEIASDARRACDDLYSAYQSLIQTLDDQCRPLLSQGPEARAVREVRDLIKWLNDESEIENNFTASLNSQSLGHVASAKYVPMMSNKMIQRFWEDKYENMPERLAEQARQREQARQAAERAQAEYEKKLANYNREMEAYRAAKAKYDEDYQKWLTQKQNLDRRCESRIVPLMKQEKERRREAALKKHQQKMEQLQLQREQTHTRRRQAEHQLAALGLFQFREKRELNAEIARLLGEESRLSSEISAGNSNVFKLLEAEDKAVEARKGAMLEEEKKRYNYPPEPQKPVEPRKPAAPSSRSSYSSGYSSGYSSSYDSRPTSTQVKNEAIMAAILDGMEPGVLYSITDLLMNIPELEDLTNQRVSAHVRELVNRGDLERIEDKRKAYFRLAE